LSGALCTAKPRPRPVGAAIRASSADFAGLRTALAELLGAFAEANQRDPLTVLDEWTHDPPLPQGATDDQPDAGDESEYPKYGDLAPMSPAPIRGFPNGAAQRENGHPQVRQHLARDHAESAEERARGRRLTATLNVELASVALRSSGGPTRCRGQDRPHVLASRDSRLAKSRRYRDEIARWLGEATHRSGNPDHQVTVYRAR
jgi:hypothetical protein